MKRILVEVMERRKTKSLSDLFEKSASLVFILFLLLCADLYGQDKALVSEEQRKVINEKIRKGQRLIRKDSVAAGNLAKEILSESQKANYPVGVVNAYRQLGLLSLLQGRLENAKSYYLLNLEFYKGGEDKVREARAYLLLTEVTKRQGDKLKTLEYLSTGLDLIEQTDDVGTLSKFLDGLGGYYRGEENFDESEQYYRKALKARLEAQDSSGLVNSYQVLGNLYGLQEMNGLAMENYHESLKFLKTGREPRKWASLYTNLGVTYYKQSIFDSARLYYERALILQESLGNQYSQTILFNNLAALAFEQNDFRESREYALKGVALAKEIDSPELLSSLYFNISDGYKAIGDYKQSFDYYKLSDSIDFALSNQAKNAQIAELQVQFESAKKDKEIVQQSLELTQADAQNQLLFAGLALVVVAASFTYGLLIRKRRSNKALQLQKSLVEKREKEKALLLRELHHRVKNNFQIVSSLLNLQYYGTKDEETAEAIKSGQARIEAMSMIHRELYQSENITTIEMEDYVRHLIDNTAYSFNYAEDDFEVKLSIDRTPIGVKYAIPLGVVINELITNSFKHAFKEVEQPKLEVCLKMDDNLEIVTLDLSDNGPGLPDSSEIEDSSFGLELIHDLVKQLKGTLIMGRDNGSHVQIEFPYLPVEAHVES